MNIPHVIEARPDWSMLLGSAFLLLVILLMVLGLVGGWLAVVISGRLSRTLAALTSAYPGESLANLPQRP